MTSDSILTPVGQDGFSTFYRESGRCKRRTCCVKGEFARRVAKEVESRTGWHCVLKLAKQEDFSEPLNRVNTEPAAALVPKWNEAKAWDGFVDFYT